MGDKMAFKIGTQLILRDGRRGVIEAAFGHSDCREYKIKCGGQSIHFTEFELLQELAATERVGVYRFDPEQDVIRR
jgi:hypothetical protein